MMILQEDITIVGGGVVGMLLAISLSKLSYKILLIEKKINPQNDQRSIVLSYSSIVIIKSLGVWEYIKNHVAYIDHIHVSEKNTYGQFQIDNKDEGSPFLGVVIKMYHLIEALKIKLELVKSIKKLFNTSVQRIYRESFASYGIIINNNNKEIYLKSTLIIAVDGSNSLIKKLLDIHSTCYDYKQCALVFDLELKRDHRNYAYERFIGNESIITLIPLTGKKASCIWTIEAQQAKIISKYSKDKILTLVQEIFGYRLGKFCKILKEPCYFPLKMMSAKSLYQDNILLFGNAAHLIHPISAQGLNLSIRDIAILYDLINSQEYNILLADNIYLQYQKIRLNDHKRTRMITHYLVNIFTNNFLIYKLVRKLGINILQHNILAKKFLSRLMMGKLNYGSTLMQEKYNKLKI